MEYFAGYFVDLKEERLWLLYKKAEMKLQAELDAFKFCKKVKNLEIFMKSVVFGKRDRIIARNIGKNLIFLDDEFAEESSDESEYEREKEPLLQEKLKICQ